MRSFLSLQVLGLLGVLALSTGAQALGESPAQASSLTTSAAKAPDHPHFNKIVKQGVSAGAFRSALNYLSVNRAHIPNRRYVTLVDYSMPISEKRMYVINLETGDVQRYFVAHARKSDPNLTGRPEVFSNVFNSEKTALGTYITSNAYDGSLGRGLVLRGVTKLNYRAEERKIVLHGWFVGPEYASHYGTADCPLQGGCPTMGCFGVAYSEVKPLIEKIKNGSLLIAFTQASLVRAYDY